MDRTPILFALARIYSHREIALNEFAHVQLCSGLRGRRQHETHILESPSGQSVALDRGRVELVGADAFARMLPHIPLPSVPFMGTYSIRVRSLSAIKTILAGAGIATSSLGADLLARFPDELGQGAWIFTERGSAG